MLKVIQNEQEVDLSYTVENNLTTIRTIKGGLRTDYSSTMFWNTTLSNNGIYSVAGGTSNLNFNLKDFTINTNNVELINIIYSNTYGAPLQLTYSNKIIKSSYSDNYKSKGAFDIVQVLPYKTPLTITLNEPLIKTSEQTMKLILDIEIE